jgi:hypothetical protein
MREPQEEFRLLEASDGLKTPHGEIWVREVSKPTGVLVGLRHVQTDQGPADIFVADGVTYLRAWFNRNGNDYVVWLEVSKTPQDGTH